jgi:hypothetical protein
MKFRENPMFQRNTLLPHSGLKISQARNQQNQAPSSEMLGCLWTTWHYNAGDLVLNSHCWERQNKIPFLLCCKHFLYYILLTFYVKDNLCLMRSEVLTVLTVKSTVFWVKTMCSLVEIYWDFQGTYVSIFRVEEEAKCSSETSVTLNEHSITSHMIAFFNHNHYFHMCILV